MAQASGACCEAKWVREHLSGSEEGNFTVRRRSDGRIPVVLCKDCKLYHSPFCQPSVYKPKGDYARVWTHVEIHRMRALQHGEFNIHVCQLQCRGERHYHCPYCSKTIITRKQFESHMEKCLEMQRSTTTAAATGVQSAAPPCTPVQLATTVGQGTFLLLNVTAPFQQTIMMGQSPAPSEPPAQLKSTANPLVEKCASNQCLAAPDCLIEPTITEGHPAAPSDLSVSLDHPSTLTDNPVKETRKIFRTVVRKIKCPMCSLYLNKKNLRKHKLRKHFCQSISEKDITAKDHLRSQCIDSYNGVYAVAKSYKATAVPVHVIKKRSDSTHKMVCGEERCEAVSDFRRKSGLPSRQCPHLQSVDFCFTRARREDLKPCVLKELVSSKWIGKDMGAKCLNYHEQASQSKAPLVTLVDLGGSHCLFLSVFEPEVSQYSKLGRMLFVTYSVKRGLWHCECSQGRISCLHKCIAKWYLLQTKKELLTSDANQDAPLSLSEFMEDSPAETSSENSTGTLYPLKEDGLKQMAKYIYNQKKLPSEFPEDITQYNSTFFKQCPDCEMVYRYPEWSEGLHNYNDHIILSLQLCMLLQKSIENHTAVDGVVEVLERTEGVKSPCAIEVLQAYLHFEALTSHNCLSVVMMDLYQKGVFNMAGFEITGLSESSIGEVNAEELWDSVCMGIIRSSLVARRSSDVSTSEDNLKEAATSAVTTLLIPAARKRLTKQRTEECHKAVTRYLVKELHPLSTVDSSWFREMAKMLNPKYQLPSRDQLMNTLMPSWYSVEKNHVIKELLQVSEAAVTCDWWTSFAQDRYLTVTLHFIIKGQMRHKVLRTKPVYDVQADTAVAEQIGGILEEFGVRDKVVAVTVDNGSSMDVAIKKSQFRKLGCFAQILSLAAQKVYFSITVTRWASRIRAVVVWIKRSSTAQTVLREKQQLLNLPQHYLVLDVRTRWGSFYLMIERFAEQYAAIQATITDPQIKQSVERLETLTDDDHQKAEELIRIMKPLYMSSLCVSADKSPTCSQIFPILKKMTANFETQDEDSLFTASLKEKARDDLSACYKMMILGSSYRSRAPWIQGSRTESTQMRFGTECKMLRLQPQQRCQIRRNTNFGMRTEMLRMYLSKTSIQMRQRLTGLEELFEDEDRALKSITEAEKTPIAERVQQEIQLYRSLPAVPTSEDALAWWWRRRDSLPLLSQLSNSYLCIQASSTPRERVFSTAGDTISRERSHILPEQADMQIFLQKNC
ncbi:uncharacterized protein LOC117260069 isoform X3 [Epinephelus lanceolatus]|uniref:uncharacterized protein LOC117260069 isoform X2 n=1 Tax=Epinephelus lanceolatus TaxID=310571 RepID=UPI00144540BE|nr:uncharacterized protein LOC117260069 isoform X2 [Epinephelus lanceolatus]